MRRPPPLLDREHFALQPVHQRAQIGPRRRMLLGHRILARFARLGQEHGAIGVVHRRPGGHRQRGAQFRSTRLVCLGSLAQPQRQRLQLCRILQHIGAEPGHDGVGAVGKARAMRPPHRRRQILAADREPLEESLQLAPVGAQRGVENVGQRRFAGLGQEKRQRRRARRIAASGALQHAAARLRDQFARCLLVEHVERRRHAGLQRKARQHVLAEGVDGEDLQAARRLQRLGEQPPRLLHVFRPAEVGADILYFALQVLVRKHRPFAELLEQPPLHLRRRRLGVGQA